MMDKEALKEALSAAKHSRKLTQAAYKAHLKSLKASLKPLKAAVEQAEKLEKEAKAALKAYKRSLKAETSTEEETAAVAPISDTTTGTEPKRRGRKAGPKAEAAAEPKERRKPGPKPKAKPEGEAKAAKPARKAAASSSGGDDLTKVKGVGDKVADMLKANGISTYADMANTSFERYKELLKENGMSQFRNPTDWASLAGELAAAPPAEEAPAEPKRRGRKAGPKAEAAAEPKERRKPGPKPKAKPEGEAKAAKPARKAAAASTSGGDDLTKVKGVGDKVADMLKANGISTYADMANTSFERYKELLKENGMSQFRNPTDWASLAGELAAAPPAEEAPAEPKRRGRKAGPKAEAAAEPKERRKPGPKPKAKPVEEAPARPRRPRDPNREDDLTLVKGVGSRVAEMLKENGIKSFDDMADTSVDRFKELLKDNNMSRFRDPSNWPELAAELAV
jgi:predicted flap endonuclease-1-like 5' DNA nuclease